jgi:hypothetical protein
MFRQFKALVMISAAVFLSASLAHASTEDESSELGYDAIVDQLSKENAATTVRARQPVATSSSMDSVMIHGGLGFANFVQGINFDDGTATTLNQRGIQAALGIDLFSPNWMSEGTFRTFAEDGDAKVRAAVHEFELKMLFKDRLTASRFGYRAGVGITGRYLTIKRKGFAEESYTTPMSVATLGGDLFVNDRFSLGADINARNALIGETIDHNSYDLTLRVDAHF